MVLARVIAFLIDYVVLGFYGAAVFGIAISLGWDERISSPLVGQLTGFISLTLPVVLYFSLLECSPWHASVGKRILRLEVTSLTPKSASFLELLIRNLAKFLPWEIAHFGIHWAFYFNRNGDVLPAWVWIPLVFSQLLAVAYGASLVLDSKNRALYERWSGTMVAKRAGIGNPD